jgi:2,4-dienoyl-CoA reductase-like NADH-dependent reductase (Old Yellow Enzyme family)
MSLLFEPFKIFNMEIKNRFMRSATTSAWSDKRGVVGSEIIDLYRELAEGGVGLIVKGHLYVLDEGKAHSGMAGISHDYHVPKLRELTDVVHKNGGKIVAQLNHAGVKSIVDRAGPSDYSEGGWKARRLSHNEIHSIVEAFGDSADRAMEAGFDGVQIHGAHGYLGSQFLSRLVNKRTDEYGGSLENRMRFLNEVYDEIRARVGDCIPVMLKMNCDDFSTNGFRIEDSVEVARAICRRGLQGLEISGGGIGQQQELRERARSDDTDLLEPSFAGYAVRIRKETKPTPMALVNGVRSLKSMLSIVEKDVADLISMSKPFVREPDLVKKLEKGQENATCTTCNLCLASEYFSKTMLGCHL